MCSSLSLSLALVIRYPLEYFSFIYDFSILTFFLSEHCNYFFVNE